MANYLTLTNLLLRRLNEVELTQVDFSQVKGIHRHARDAINAAIADIQTDDTEWPFGYMQYTQTLSTGIGLYDLPADSLKVDQESFFLLPDPNYGVDGAPLLPISWDDWHVNYRALDIQADPHVPIRVFLTPHNKFGVSPLPAYPVKVQYQYYKLLDPLVNYNDSCPIPDAFNNVIVDGAMWYMSLQRDNHEVAQMAERKYQKGLKRMRVLLINKNDYMRDTRVPGRG